MKPIETIYKGYRFRSRLEARWAVFFDHLRIRYEYEPEGYEMDDGTRYLPDFYLPEFGYYVEVKGMNHHLVQDMRKLRKFVKEKKTALIILSDIPYAEAARGLYLFPTLVYSARYCSKLFYNYAFFSHQYKGDDVYIVDHFTICTERSWYAHRRDNEGIYKALQAIPGTDAVDNAEYFYIKDWYDLGDISDALFVARSARFEHGEVPA